MEGAAEQLMNGPVWPHIGSTDARRTKKEESCLSVPSPPSIRSSHKNKLMPFARCWSNLFQHIKQGCFWDVYGIEQVPAALLKCQSCKHTRLPCLPPARLTLEQAEAGLSFCPFPGPGCPEGWRVSQLPALCVPVAWRHPVQSQASRPRLLPPLGRSTQSGHQILEQHPPEGDSQGLMRP